MQDIDFGASKFRLFLILVVTLLAIVNPSGYSPLQPFALYQDASYFAVGRSRPCDAVKHPATDAASTMARITFMVKPLSFKHYTIIRYRKFSTVGISRVDWLDGFWAGGKTRHWCRTCDGTAPLLSRITALRSNAPF